MHRSRYLIAAAAIMSALGSSIGSAHAATNEPQLAATVSRTTLHSRGARSFMLRVRIANSGPAQRVDVDVHGAAWPGGQTAGGPLSFGAPSLEGPGTVTVAAYSVPAILPYACARGPQFDRDALIVDVPAATTTTLVLPLRAVVPPWPGTDYTPAVSAIYADGTDVGVSVPRVRMTGPTGFRIALAVKHPQTWIRAGTPVTIVGSTSPRVPNAFVRL